MKKFIVLIITVCVFVLGCSNKSNDTVWIYTSTPPDETNALAKAIAEKFPGVDIQWYVGGGSENVQARIAMESLSGDPKANIIMTSDLFWFEKMAMEGKWTNYQPHISRWVKC